jgi:endonuclease/exonuclease/phosphatase family metal-dependent hydrolase
MKLFCQISLTALSLLVFVSCSPLQRGGLVQTDKLAIGFYNVENLFDTVDDPHIPDEEFTPTSKKEWTPERYGVKLAHLAKVVDGMGYPALLGLAEVENATVLTDFCEKTSLAAKGYAFAHFDSPDERGIDVALLFQKKYFKILHAEPLAIHFSAEVAQGDPNPATRDILFVQGILPKKDTLYVMVVHAPSRSGGQKETEPERIFVAEKIRSKADEIFSKNPNANIVIMGDFNDEPTDPSIAQILDAQPLTENIQPARLYNCFSKLDAQNLGTYNYRGNWNMLDQVILSGNLIQRKNGLHFKEAAIFSQEWMMYEDKKYGPAPSRTYGGDHYFGGYSDHLPVMVTLGR